MVGNIVQWRIVPLLTERKVLYMRAPEQTSRVAVALFEGFTVLDVYGPVQAFASCRVPTGPGSFRRLFEIFSMAERSGVVKSSEGPPSYAEYSLAEAPDFDILLIPGGFGTRTAVNSPSLLTLLSAASQRASVTATVCTGSALLARTGLLDHRPATSNKLAWDWVVQQGPQVKWIRKARWVDDGNIVTSSGVSAGIDMALSLVARLHGRDMALTSARNMEYRWHAEATDDPFA
jgi:transcriptional regulator GlxA family with amidase domain